MPDVRVFPPGSRAFLERSTPAGTLATKLRVVRSDGERLVLGDPSPPGTPLPEQGARAIARIDAGATTYVLEVTVAGRTDDGHCLVDLSGLVERFPKRRYFRIAVDLPLEVRGVACRAIDLSGCGLLAQVPADLAVADSDIVPGALHLEEGIRVQVALCAMRIGTAAGRHRHVGFDFVSLSDSDQDRIIAYVLRQHRRKLRWLR